MNISFETLALAKKYVQDSLEGAGALVGKSAYDIAVINGFSGTQTQWLESLKGEQGEKGETSEPQVFRVDNKSLLPAIGQEEVLYIVSDTNDTYIWYNSPPGYKAAGAQGAIDEIKIISGGTI